MPWKKERNKKERRDIGKQISQEVCPARELKRLKY